MDFFYSIVCALAYIRWKILPGFKTEDPGYQVAGLDKSGMVQPGG
jgi:hypothetical protein